MTKLDAKLNEAANPTSAAAIPPQSSSAAAITTATGTGGPTASGSAGTSMSMASLNPGVFPPPRAINSVPLINAPESGLAAGAGLAAGGSLPTIVSSGIPVAKKQPVVVGPNATLVAQALVTKIRNNEFVELADLAGDNLAQYQEKSASSGSDSKGDRPKRRKISNILQWVECFNAYMVIFNQPERMPDLLAYSSLIVHAARKFKGDGWLHYDRNLRKRAAAGAGDKWGEVNTSLWALAFANAQPKEHCALCFSLDHTTQACEDYTEPSEQVKKQQKDEASVPICMKWNWQFCQSASCRYRHNVCVECHEDHKANCPRLGSSRRFSPYSRKGSQGRRVVLFATSEATSQPQPQVSMDSSINSIADYLIAKHILPCKQAEPISADHFSPITLRTLEDKIYPYTSHLLALDSYRPPPPSLPTIHEIEAIVSPLIPEAWEAALVGHPDRQLADYITKGIRQGFRIGFNRATPLGQVYQNMPSAEQNPEVVTAYLEKELQESRLLQLWSLPASIHTSRFGVIPKRHQPGNWRLILDLSFPQEASVNVGISKELTSLQYVTVDHAAKIIADFGPHTELAKIDIAHAYRNIPVHPQDRPLLGMQWGGQVYIDTVLPFGLSSAPKIFCAVSDTLEWILHQRGLTSGLHYIDDFLTFGQAGSQECKDNLERLLATCKELGIPLKVSKIEGPSTIIIFLGIEFDTQRMEMRLPEEKKARLHSLIQSWLQRERAASKREILSLLGELSHACKVVIPGRIFLRRLINLACSRPNINDWIRLNEEAKADLRWWDLFLSKWNGVSMLKSHTERPPDVHVFTDASGSWGCGASWEDRWFKAPWSTAWLSVNITIKEMVPIILALAVWGQQWASQHVQIHSDNMAVVEIVRAKSSRDRKVMHLLRCMHFFMARHDIRLTAVHVPGVSNSRADALSRNNVPLFMQITPQARRSQTTIPENLWALVVESEVDWLSPAWRSKLGSL